VSERARILVVEDDRGVRESLAMVLEYQQYEVCQAPSGEDGLTLAASRPPDLVILDINLPGIDGFETCRRLRARGFTGKVLMLTARHEVNDRVSGLDAGADDYLPKPFALEELLARVRASLRHSPAVEAQATTILTLDDLRLDTRSRQVTRGDRPIELTKIEFDLLELLLRNAGAVLARDVIHDRIWGYPEDLGSNSLEVFVSSLRKKLEADGASRLIHTVRGVGYVARVGS
jgi:two-component system response regulator MprA